MTTPSKSGKRAVSIALLLAVACTIILLGVSFGIYALVAGVTFSVMSMKIPGVIFAAVVVFLGVRYFLATLKLAKNIRDAQFSWRNFLRSAKGNI